MSKSKDAFRTISEVSDWLGTQAHVLRFWESKFDQLNPVRRPGGRRYYRPLDITLLEGIKYLLHDQGSTIKSVQRLLKKEGVGYVRNFSSKLTKRTTNPTKNLTNNFIKAKEDSQSLIDRVVKMPFDNSEIDKDVIKASEEQLHLFPTFEKNESELRASQGLQDLNHKNTDGKKVKPALLEEQLISSVPADSEERSISGASYNIAVDLGAELQKKDPLLDEFIGAYGPTSMLVNLTNEQRHNIFNINKKAISELKRLVEQINV